MRGKIAGGLAAIILCSPAISGPILADVDDVGPGQVIRPAAQPDSGAGPVALAGLGTGVLAAREQDLRFADEFHFLRFVQGDAPSDGAVAWGDFGADGFLLPPGEPGVLSLLAPP